VKKKLISLLEENQIEYRPIVGGNLLKQPYLNYKIECENENLNVNILHENGVYIGNNQFVNQKNIKKIKDILSKL
jgi:CDP-6-deoxy-D-xylo-4-hexulose-3-dehydrase